MHRAIAALVVAVALAGCRASSGAERPSLTVAAAASLRTAFTAYGEAFPDARARFSFAGSDELAAQLRQGVAPDVFAAADTALPEALHEEGLVERPVTFAANRLVVAVERESPLRALGDLAGADVTLAIGSASVPVGAYTRAVLARMPAGPRRRVLARVRSHEPDVGGIVGKLMQGAVAAGFVYATDVAAAGGVLRAIELPDRLQPRIAYAAAVVRGAAHPAEARAFVAGLLAGRGREALRAAGFEPPPGR